MKDDYVQYYQSSLPPFYIFLGEVRGMSVLILGVEGLEIFLMESISLPGVAQ